MDSYDIKLTRQAKQQLMGIRKYIEEELLSPEAALNTIRKLRSEIHKLSDMPQRIKTIREEPWGSEGIRKIHVNNYYVYFWINEPEQTVIVTAVIYAARDQIRQLEQMKKE